MAACRSQVLRGLLGTAGFWRATLPLPVINCVVKFQKTAIASSLVAITYARQALDVTHPSCSQSAACCFTPQATSRRSISCASVDAQTVYQHRNTQSSSARLRHLSILACPPPARNRDLCALQPLTRPSALDRCHPQRQFPLALPSSAALGHAANFGRCFCASRHLSRI